MTVARPIVAVIPFGARGMTPRAGAWARQLAAQLVERFARDEAVDVRPVFLVAMPEATSEAGYLVYGSSPGADLETMVPTTTEPVIKVGKRQYARIRWR